MDSDTLTRLIAQELTRATEWHESAWAPHQAEALAYYYGTPRGDEVAGRSALVSLDLSDAVESIIAQMQPAFAGQSPVVFEPESQEDEAQAQQETAFVHRALSAEGQGFVATCAAAKDALLSRNCILHVYMEERETVDRETLREVDVAALELIARPTAQLQTVSLEYDDPSASDETLESVTVTRTTLRRRLRVAAVAPEDVRIWPDWASLDLSAVPFFAERKRVARGELVELGISQELAESLPAATQSDEVTRRARDQGQAPPEPVDQVDPSLDLVEYWDCHIRCDWEGDGRSRLVRAWYHSGDASSNAANAGILVKDAEEVEFHGYAAGVALLQPHRFLGLSAHDKLKQIQDGKTGVLRQWQDNLRFMNDRRLGIVDSQVNAGDAVQSLPGGFIRMNAPGQVFPIPVDDVGVSALSALSYYDKTRSDRIGAALDLQSGAAQVQGGTAFGVDRQYAARELLADLMLRTIGETALRGMYLIAHRTLRTWSPGKMSAKLAGTWSGTDPGTWKARDNVSVNLAGGAGKRAAQAGALMQTIGLQAQAFQAGKGGELVDDVNVYNAVLSWSRAAGLEQPESYWTDPRSPEAQQASQGKAQQQQAAQAQQVELTKAVAHIAAMLEKYKVDTETRFKYFDAVLKAETKEAELIGTATTQLEALQVQGVLAMARPPAPVQGAGPGGGNGGAPGGVQ
jgi:hypothetical protein